MNIYDSDPQSEYGHINSDQFKVTSPDKKVFVCENFYDDPYAVRDFALEQWYHDDEGFLGYRTRKQYYFDNTKEKFEKVLGMKITEWEGHTMNGRFQSNKAGTPLVYHCDEQTWAACVYLTPNAPVASGTSFFQHRETGLRGGEANIGEAFNGKTFVDRTPYEMVDTVGNVFNRLVIWDAKLIHSATDYFGWDINSSRLFHIFFFDAE